MVTHSPLSHLTDDELLRHADAVASALMTTVLEREFAARMPALLDQVGVLEAEVAKLEDESQTSEALLILLGDYDCYRGSIDLLLVKAALQKATKYDELVAQLAEIQANHTLEKTQ